MTPSLCELQRAFAAGVYDDSTAVLAHVRDGAFSASQHFQVYRNNTFANLTDALAACYPVIRKLVGEEFFDHLANAYVCAHPPRSGNLHDFGAALPAFLTTFEPARSLVYLPDVARLEWAWQEAYHAADAAPLAPETLADVPPQAYAHLVFHPHPSTRLLQSAFPCLRIWQVNQPEFAQEPTVDLDAGAERLLVVRHSLDIVIAALGVGEYAMLCGFAAGQPLGTVAETALTAEPSFDLGAALRHHVAVGTLTGFDELTPNQEQPPEPQQ